MSVPTQDDRGGSAVGLLVSIDNGGTLTDVCATDGVSTIHAKTLTTPHDLTECFVKCLEALSEKIVGEVDLPKLVGMIDYIRYSTTQGTNAIVQRKGPRIGLLTDDDATTSDAMNAAPALFEAFIGDRIRVLSSGAVTGDENAELVMAVSKLVSAGASRIVIAFSGAEAAAREKAAKRILYRAFPRHLLGAVPLLFSTELTRIGTLEQRVWTSIVNAFLHPAMETFLYNAENRLREHRARKPLLIFRNDGNSTRVAKTVAIKTYSSGPQGGVVGGEVLLKHYGIPNAVSIDIGGTTTDIAMFDDAAVAVAQSGHIEGAPVSIPLAAIESIGAGGGSIIRAEGGKILVGPESVGSAPGPACFARGGTKATMTGSPSSRSAFSTPPPISAAACRSTASAPNAPSWPKSASLSVSASPRRPKPWPMPITARSPPPSRPGRSKIRARRCLPSAVRGPCPPAALPRKPASRPSSSRNSPLSSAPTASPFPTSSTATWPSSRRVATMRWTPQGTISWSRPAAACSPKASTSPNAISTTRC